MCRTRRRPAARGRRASALASTSTDTLLNAALLTDGGGGGRAFEILVFEDKLNVVDDSDAWAIDASSNSSASKSTVTVLNAALETGAFYESLNLAALKNLPLLIILEDNEYSTYSNKKVRWPENKNVKSII